VTAHRHARIQVVFGNITCLAVDAIVNAANERMLGGSGVDGAIHRAAGPELLDACRAVPEVRPGVRCPTGESRMTPGFRLAARHVIHTVGPVWRGGAVGEPELLAGCYRSTLELAREHRVNSIAFPAISCGVFGYPVDRAAAVAVSTITAALAAHDTPESVVLVAFDVTTEQLLTVALQHGLANLGRDVRSTRE
jgi:O-acetyl-ADP-ribose deacetylase (regulator of RNase III)